MKTGLDHCSKVDYKEKFKSCIGEQNCFIENLDSISPSDCEFDKDEAKVFIQYNCLSTDESLHLKWLLAMLSASVSTFSALIFIAIAIYYEKMIPIQYELWDLKVVTAADYTIKINLDKTFCSKIINECRTLTEPNDYRMTSKVTQ